jgi:CRISPR/Cas system-associated exonuclease Cas4 (RecB family)
MIKTIQHLDWDIIKQAALTTKGLKQKSAVTSEWKKKALLSEHSMLYFSDLILEVDMQYKTAMHLVRHNKTAGFYMLIQSQRPDWTNKPRDVEAVVKTIIKVNPKALIEISRTRMCNKAALHTIETWSYILCFISKTEPELTNACMPNCLYRKCCTEFESCGLWDKLNK